MGPGREGCVGVGSSVVTNVSTLVRDIGIGGGYAYAGVGLCEKSLYLLFSFAVMCKK